MSYQIMGLPGAGKKRFERENAAFLSAQDVVLTVIDIRSNIPSSEMGLAAEAYLRDCVSRSDAVVFMFMEAAALDQQLYWQSWIKQHATMTRVLRSFHGNLSDQAPVSKETSRSLEASSLIEFPLEEIEFVPAKINLEHLMMGLDAAIQNLGMQLFRVQGTFQTFEYENLVTLEGTYNRMDMYPATDEEGISALKIRGRQLEPVFLKQIFDAASE